MTTADELVTNLSESEIRTDVERAERRGELQDEATHQAVEDAVGVLLARGEAMSDEEVARLLEGDHGLPDAETVERDVANAMALRQRLSQ